MERINKDNGLIPMNLLSPPAAQTESSIAIVQIIWQRA